VTVIFSVRSDHLPVSKSNRTSFCSSAVIATICRPSGDQRGIV
jgi:hypothetical protein